MGRDLEPGGLWKETPANYSLIVKARAQARGEQAIIAGYWGARLHLDAEGGSGKPLGEYLDELLSEEELLEKSSARLAAWFDGMIEGGEATEQ